MSESHAPTGPKVASTTKPLIDPNSETLPASASERAALGRAARVGRYMVLELIGRGGMGEVYSAYDSQLDRRVAVKLLHTASGTAGTRESLLREGRALAKLSHPNVVQVHDVGEHDGDVFVAMELIEGEPLDAWCESDPRPTWRQVLDAYLDAARGLAAAHAKGIVHRDVKPSNILRGLDGRVRVVDFGLATDLPGADLAPPGLPSGMTSSGESSIARTPRTHGSIALVGTPGYMAPEQFQREGVGPASDQYALCAAIYLGLYGRLPFEWTRGTELLELIAHKQEELPASPPEGSPVPSVVYRALRRGMSPRAEDRFPSIAALIDALAPPRAPRRWPWVALALTATAATAVTLAVTRGGVFSDPCAHVERQLAGAWDDAARSRVRSALEGTGRSYAPATASRVLALLDSYAGAWTTMRHDVCEAKTAKRLRADVAELRDQCLDRRLGQLGAAVEVLGEKPDVGTLDKAVQVADGLVPIASCADLEALTARVPPPEDPAVRARVAALAPRVDRIEALARAARYKEGLALAEPLYEETRALPYAPARAQAALLSGGLHADTGDFTRGRALFEGALLDASAGKDDVLSAKAWAKLLYLVIEQQRHLEEATVIRALGRGAIARAHDDDEQARWLDAEGLVFAREMKFDEAIAAYERAAALDAKTHGAESADVASAMNNLGNVYGDAGQMEKASAAYERAIEIYTKVLGPEHPQVANALNNLGTQLDSLGDARGALAAFDRALAIREAAFGPDHPGVATALSNVCRAQTYLAQYDLARPACARALAIREKAFGPKGAPVSATLDKECELFTATGDLDQAIAACQRSVAIQEADTGPDDVYVAMTLVLLGGAQLSAGSTAAAEATFARAVAIYEKALPADYADLADPLAGLGRCKVRTGDLGGAGALLERAQRIRTKALGADSPNQTEILLGLGELAIARGTPGVAVPLLEKAASFDVPYRRPEVLLTLADAITRAHGDAARARALTEESRALAEKGGNVRRRDAAARWLAANGR
jgi:serine/threonine-protein kinase